MLTGTSLNQLKLIAAEAEKATIPIYIVGGLVRDLLSHSLENSFDLDLMIESEPESFAHKIANILCGTAEKITPFLTVKIRIQNSADGFREIDIAQARSEIYRHPGAYAPGKVHSAYLSRLLKITEQPHLVLVVRGEDLRILIADQACDPQVLLHWVLQIVLISLGRQHQHRVFALLQRVFKQPELILITNLHLHTLPLPID